MPRPPFGEARPAGRATPNDSNPIVHDAHGWRAIGRNGTVYLTETNQDREPGLEPWQAMEVALAILHATLDAKRGGRS